MSVNIDTYTFKCPDKQKDKTGKDTLPNFKATDLHIHTGENSVEVLGIEGSDPKAPNCPYGVGVNGNTGDITITGISVNPGDALHVRLKHTKNENPLNNFKYEWTYPPAKAGDPPGNKEPQTYTIAMDDNGSSELDDHAMMLLRPWIQYIVKSVKESGGLVE